MIICFTSGIHCVLLSEFAFALRCRGESLILIVALGGDVVSPVGEVEDGDGAEAEAV